MSFERMASCMHDQMLESNRDDVKLEAMRCVTVMTAKGKLTVPRTLFPHIVKNVTSTNPELKKLIYLYLTNFADQEPDLALLPVATLQKSLKSPNPLIRSSALKVLTSMRLNILSAILMATLRDSVNDLSPYVRKTVAHSIIKIYRLDPELRSDLIEYIERLFNDKNSMVLSSAVATFEVVCPEKLDLVHKHYRRFCFILADCNEWGQTLLLNLLMRYVLKTYQQFKNGEITDYIASEHDPKILLRSAKPLVHSHNSAVVMAVIKLFINIANHNEVRSTITRPLVRLLYSHREVQLTVLNMIEDLTSLKDSTSEPVNDLESDEGSVIDGNTIDQRPTETKQDEPKSEKLVPAEPETVEHLEDEREILKQSITRDGYIPLGDDNESTRASSPSQPDDSKQDAGEEKEQIECVNDVEANDKKEEDSVGIEKVGGDDKDDEEEEDEEESEEDEDDEADEDEGATSEEEESEEDEEDEAPETEDTESEKDIDIKRDIGMNFVDLDSNKDPAAFREVFRPYIKSFFVKHTDCTQVRLAKLKILTNLSSSFNVSLVLKELQAYISIYVDDKEFVSAAIHAIGRCAVIVKEVAHACLNRLTSLLSNSNEHIVSEAIVVLRSQIINKKPSKEAPTGTINKLDDGTDEQSKERLEDGSEGADDTINQKDSGESDGIADEKIVSTVIKQVTKLLPNVTAPLARATILWILAEFCDKNITAAKCAPNVLRTIARTFCQEDNFVKLQSLTLASKFLLFLDKEKKAELYNQVQLLTGYLFSLAKYDINHDVRDRGRFLKKLLDDEEICAKVLGAHNSNQKLSELAA